MEDYYILPISKSERRNKQNNTTKDKVIKDFPFHLHFLAFPLQTHAPLKLMIFPLTLANGHWKFGNIQKIIIIMCRLYLIWLVALFLISTPPPLGIDHWHESVWSPMNANIDYLWMKYLIIIYKYVFTVQRWTEIDSIKMKMRITLMVNGCCGSMSPENSTFFDKLFWNVFSVIEGMETLILICAECKCNV